ncbi:hypothetical protein [Nesterenkonia sp. NBAIMH1]|uniref:hypothetical protein n=1 Tax=Nesterenkonia sp. NBAIMH1 TaxID=2600320 RepID=UPI00143DDF93|nr:hypothetical protein [Nesterenkonia sp. NBAIMH1]
MSSPRRPSPQVARRRQLVAAVLGVLLLALVIWVVSALMGTGDDETDQQGAGQSQDDIPAPEGSGSEQDEDAETGNAEQPDDVPEGHCHPDDVLVTADTHADSYAADEAVRMIMQVRNVSGDECAIEVGTAEQTWSISHNGSEIFTTEECDITGDSFERDFAAGETVRADLNWPRSDSSEDCSAPAAIPSGEYQLTVSVSGTTSYPHTFTVEGADPE